MQKGWILLHRKLLDNPLMKRPAYRSVWIELLLRATHDGTEVMFDGKRLNLKPGQLTAGAYQIAVSTGVPRGTVERILKTFKNEEQIEVVSDRQCSLITVKKWSQYQKREEQSEERVRNDRGTSEERVRTKQQGNNEKKVTMKQSLAKAKETESRKYEDGTELILLKDEIMSQIDDRDRSFPRKRVFGDEKVDWILDYSEHLLGRKLGGKEVWNRRYARHLANKHGMTKVKALLEYVCAPESWWFDKLTQMGSLYKHSERLLVEMTAKPKSENKILVIS